MIRKITNGKMDPSVADSNIPEYTDSTGKTFRGLEALKVHRDNRAQEMYLLMLRDSEQSIKDLGAAIADGMQYDTPLVQFPNPRTIATFDIHECTDFLGEGLSNGGDDFISFEEILASELHPKFFIERLRRNIQIPPVKSYTSIDNTYQSFDILQVRKSSHEETICKFYSQKHGQVEEIYLVDNELYVEIEHRYLRGDPYDLNMGFLDYFDNEKLKKHSRQRYSYTEVQGREGSSGRYLYQGTYILHAGSRQMIYIIRFNEKIRGRTRSYKGYYFTIDMRWLHISVELD